MTASFTNNERSAGRDYEVVVVGNGAAAAAVVERIVERRPETAICVLGCGREPVHKGAPFRDHVAPNLPPVETGRAATREAYLTESSRRFHDGPGLPAGDRLCCLGGNETAGGNHFPRQYAADLADWPSGVRDDLPAYYELAEVSKGVAASRPAGSGQAVALSRLADLGAHPTPRGYATVDGKPDRTRRTPSAAARLAAHAAGGRVVLGRDRYVTSLRVRDGRVRGAVVRDWSDPAAPGQVVKGKLFVIALGPCDAVRLLLNSGLRGPGVGVALQAHRYLRGWFEATIQHAEGGLDVIVPPPSASAADRFTIEVKTHEPLERGAGRVRITASVPVGPDVANRVTLSGDADRHGVPKAWVELVPSAADERRAARAAAMAQIVGRALGVRSGLPLQLALGSSHHEAGGLSVGAGGPVDADCRLKGTTNLFISGRPLFPHIGLANPVLTMTALGMRLADHLGDRLGTELGPPARSSPTARGRAGAGAL